MGFFDRLFHRKKSDIPACPPIPKVVPFSEFKPKTPEEIQKMNDDHAANLDRIDLSDIESSPAYAGTFTFWELEFLSDIERIKFNSPSIGRYWTTQRGIDFNSLLHRLWGAGYISSVSPSMDLSAFKVPELKNILSTHNLPVNGTKSVLIQRIIDNVSTSSLKKEGLIGNRYLVTEAGHFAIHESRQKQIEKDMSTAYAYRIHGEYSCWRSCMWKVMDLYDSEEQWPLALSTAIKLYRFDLFYFSTLEVYKSYLSSRRCGLPVKSQAMIAPRIIGNVIKFIENGSVSASELDEIYNESFLENDFPDCICSKSEAFSLLKRYLTEDYDALAPVVDGYNKRFDARHFKK